MGVGWAGRVQGLLTAFPRASGFEHGTPYLLCEKGAKVAVAYPEPRRIGRAGGSWSARCEPGQPSPYWGQDCLLSVWVWLVTKVPRAELPVGVVMGTLRSRIGWNYRTRGGGWGGRSPKAGRLNPTAITPLLPSFRCVFVHFASFSSQSSSENLQGDLGQAEGGGSSHAG